MTITDTVLHLRHVNHNLELQPRTACLPVQEGRVLDRASERLGLIRRQRRDNMQSLRQSMNEWARNLASQNISEEALVVIRRDRLCVPVKAGRQVSYLNTQKAHVQAKSTAHNI